MTMPREIARLDEALARNVALEVEARNAQIRARKWKAKYDQAVEDLETCQAQAKLADEITRDLTRMVDTLRAERDDWRARASQ